MRVNDSVYFPMEFYHNPIDTEMTSSPRPSNLKLKKLHNRETQTKVFSVWRGFHSLCRHLEGSI